MAGAAVPAAGAIGADLVTNAQQETNLENLAEALRRMPGVGVTASSVTTISAGSIAPTRGIVIVDTEGATATDNLDWIDPNAFLPNSILFVTGNNPWSRIVTIRHAQGGVGMVSLVNGSGNFALADGFAWIAFRLVTTVWVEVARSHGTDLAAARTALGLGSVATLNNGAVNAATLQGNAAAAFLAAAGTAANSTLFGGLATSAFLRANVASLLTIDGSLKALGGRFEADVASGAGSPIVALRAGGNPRTDLFFEGVSGNAFLRLLSSGGAVQAGIRFRSGLIPDYWDGAAWVPLFSISSTPAWFNNVRWDKTDGNTTYSSGSHHVMHSVAPPVLPGSSATRVYRIRGAIVGRRAGASDAEFRAELYSGSNGNESDTRIHQAPVILANVAATDFSSSFDNEFTIPTAPFLTLVLNRTNGNATDVRQGTAGTYSVEKRTYLRIDQVG